MTPSRESFWNVDEAIERWRGHTKLVKHLCVNSYRRGTFPFLIILFPMICLKVPHTKPKFSKAFVKAFFFSLQKTLCPSKICPRGRVFQTWWGIWCSPVTFLILSWSHDSRVRIRLKCYYTRSVKKNKFHDEVNFQIFEHNLTTPKRLNFPVLRMKACSLLGLKIAGKNTSVSQMNSVKLP